MTNKFVFDTNVLISAFLIPESIPNTAFRYAMEHGEILFSPATFLELNKIIFRPKFDKFLSVSIRIRNLKRIKDGMTLVIPSETLTICRDPQDDKFLELALAAEASCIVTGDNDLLELHPFRKIPILSPADFLNVF